MSLVCEDVVLSRNGVSILNGVSVQVDRGQIFGLLGPSGCGKTSLLKCFLGDLHPDSGVVTVVEEKCGRSANRFIGYMPQEEALCHLFDVYETLLYFGRIYDMSEANIHLRIRFVCKLLRLDSQAKVRHMSNGQRRRLSLAVSLLHAPPILILDEPTVGVDPLLSREIWRYLRKLTEEFGTTIIVTTHYIEEAAAADTVAVMHEGRILLQGSPEALVKYHRADSLEDVVLEVCRRPEDVKYLPIGRPVQNHVILKGNESNLIQDSYMAIASIRRLRTLLFKERCSFARHPGTILYKCVFPLITLSLFFYTMECDLPAVPLAIVDEDHSNHSWIIRELLAMQKSLRVHDMNKSLAIQSLKGFNITAILTLPKHYSKTKNSTLQIDSINPYFITTIENVIRDTFYSPLVSPIDYGTLLRSKSLYGHISDKPYKSVYHRIVAQLSFGPSMLASVTHVFVSAHDDFIGRTKIAGCNTVELVSSFIISQGVLVLIQTLLLVVYLFLKVKVSITLSSWLLVSALLAGVGFSGISLSLLVCSECSAFTAALYLALLLNVVTFVMCGEIWPREGMPLILRENIAPFWPISYPADAMGVVLFKNRWFSDTTVQYGIAAVAAWTICPIVILVIINSFRRNSVF